MEYSPELDINQNHSPKSNEANDFVEKTKSFLTAIACLGFFPGVYFIGKLITDSYSSESAKVASTFFWY